MQNITYPRGRAITAIVEVDVLEDFGAPVQLLQNNGSVDASVTFNGGVPFLVRASETVVYSIPIVGVILSDQDLVALA